jgi:hypothetical protein
MIKREDIDARLADSKDDGLWAEFDDGGHLTYIAYHEAGRPVPQCWAIHVDNRVKTATAVRSFELSRPVAEAEGESWLALLVAQVVAFKQDEHRCSFCQEVVPNVAHLIKGPGVSICDKCVELSMEVLIEADAFSRGRALPLLLKRRGTNKGQTQAT